MYLMNFQNKIPLIFREEYLFSSTSIVTPPQNHKHEFLYTPLDVKGDSPVVPLTQMGNYTPW